MKDLDSNLHEYLPIWVQEEEVLVVEVQLLVLAFQFLAEVYLLVAQQLMVARQA